MKNLFLVFAHILATIAKLRRHGGAKALVAENLVLKRQLLSISRSRQRAPNLLPLDRLYLGLLATLLGPRRSSRSAIIIRPSTILGFHRALRKWKYRLLYGTQEIKTVPHTPLSHPFTERLIGTIRRKYLDRTLFWNERDLEEKLGEFKNYFNTHRVHQALSGKTPNETAGGGLPNHAELSDFSQLSHCNGMLQTPIAA